MVAVMALGYLYMRHDSAQVTLVSIGLMSFVAVAQFAPALLGGLFWRGATKAGAIAGISAGFAVWCYTLLHPVVRAARGAIADFIADRAVRHRPAAALCAVRPRRPRSGDAQRPSGRCSSISARLLGVSMLAPAAARRARARGVVRRCRQSRRGGADLAAHRADPRSQFAGLALSRPRAHRRRLRQLGARTRPRSGDGRRRPTPRRCCSTSGCSASVIGAASARVLVGAIVEEEPLGVDEVMRILDETSRVIEANRQLEEKSRALETATAELQAGQRAAAGARPAEGRFRRDGQPRAEDAARLDPRLLRDPARPPRPAAMPSGTSFCASSSPRSERLTRLIGQLLDLSKIEATAIMPAERRPVDLAAVAYGIRRRHAAGVRRTRRRAATPRSSRSRARHRRSRPAGAGADQSSRQCGEVLAARSGQAALVAAAHRRRVRARGRRQWARHPRRRTGRSSSSASASSATR